MPVKRRCSHTKRKAPSRECAGSALCVHRMRNTTCRDCGGRALCAYCKFKTTCIDCGGISISEHRKHRATCRYCNNCPCTIEGGPLYGHRIAGAESWTQPLCSRHSGEPTALTKDKELVLFTELQKTGVSFEYQTVCPIQVLRFELLQLVRTSSSLSPSHGVTTC